MIEESEGRRTEAITRLRGLADMEESLPFTFGPPFVDSPTHELLGQLLLAVGQIDEAREAFRTALDRAPGRRLAREGLTKTR